MHDERRVDIGFLERRRTPGLDHQSSRNGLQHRAVERAAECLEFAPGFGADRDFATGDRRMRLRIEIHRVECLGRSRQGYRLFDEFCHRALLSQAVYLRAWYRYDRLTSIR